MKKNKMMRLAAVLLVAVLMTTCAISGTFAKYITQADVEDFARVAKWGVQVTATGSLFETQYANDGTVEKDEANQDIAFTVVSSSSTDEDVVAPGTFNNDGLVFNITGTPEVAVNIDFAITNVSDVKLPATEEDEEGYLDYTTGNNATDTFKLDKDYYPLVYTLTRNDSQVAQGTMADIETYLNGIEGNYAANTNLATALGEFKLSWTWVFGDAANNKADTYLGQVAADPTLDNSVTLTAGATIAITVAQID